MVVIVSVLIIAICLNAYLWIRRPHDGEIVITTDHVGKKVFSLELDKTPEEIEKMKRVSFKVVSIESADADVVQLQLDEVAD